MTERYGKYLGTFVHYISVSGKHQLQMQTTYLTKIITMEKCELLENI